MTTNGAYLGNADLNLVEIPCRMKPRKEICPQILTSPRHECRPFETHLAIVNSDTNEQFTA